MPRGALILDMMPVRSVISGKFEMPFERDMCVAGQYCASAALNQAACNAFFSEPSSTSSIWALARSWSIAFCSRIWM